MTNEKHPHLPAPTPSAAWSSSHPPATAPVRNRLPSWLLKSTQALLILLLTGYYLSAWLLFPRTNGQLDNLGAVGCPRQPDPIVPPVLWNMTEAEKEVSIERFIQAVRIPTESYDDNGEPNEDPRWKPFFEFLKWHEKTFPLAHEKGKIEYINTLGILATFQGSDPSLKPMVLMSHYDVVPAPESTYDRWRHPPYSGFNDGTYIWGRGSADCKSLFVAQWEAITHLLEGGFKPRRTLILSHGFDEEEVTAGRGQGHIAPVLLERYGTDGIFMLVDEGSGTTEDWYGGAFALPGMGEKGYLDVKVSVGTPGGHSSVPPEHTGIGIMAKVVEALEAHPFESKLTADSPYLTSLMCAAEYAPSFPKKLARMLKRQKDWPALSKLLAKTSPHDRAITSTTQAVDIISGGVKINALPEAVTALVNYRIDFSESTKSTQQHIEKAIKPVAERFGLKYLGFDSAARGNGSFIRVEQVGRNLEPAPRTPTDGDAWKMFAGTLRAVMKDKHGKPLVVAPSAATLTKNVYRFMGVRLDFIDSGIHSVNEHATVQGHYDVAKWIHALIQNVDSHGL